MTAAAARSFPIDRRESTRTSMPDSSSWVAVQFRLSWPRWMAGRITDGRNTHWTSSIASCGGSTSRWIRVFQEGIIHLNDFVLRTRSGGFAHSRTEANAASPADMIRPERCRPGRTLPVASVTSIRTDSLMASSSQGRLFRWKPTCCPALLSGNQRGFRTDLPISPGISLELILRGVSQLRQPIDTLIAAGDTKQLVESRWRHARASAGGTFESRANCK